MFNSIIHVEWFLNCTTRVQCLCTVPFPLFLQMPLISKVTQISTFCLHLFLMRLFHTFAIEFTLFYHSLHPRIPRYPNWFKNFFQIFRFNFCAIKLGLDKSIVFYIYHYSITWNSLTAPKSSLGFTYSSLPDLELMVTIHLFVIFIQFIYSLRVVFPFRMWYKWYHTVCSLLRLASFTQQYGFKIHLCLRVTR